jgi:hypothetical protein
VTFGMIPGVILEEHSTNFKLLNNLILPLYTCRPDNIKRKREWLKNLSENLER